ncbi:transglutaminase domain-containing protein [Crocinitomix algicola]|uniref:transglutaminase domain-containing protein n=1 Tax=Crocinitomix algicola TaxID=1740263 RepID=UPI000872569D|nr:transglutaminase domain-containing protein [Crocinitomix algicola]
MRNLITLFFIYFFSFSFGQVKEDKIPNNVKKSIPRLTQHLIRGKISQEEKALAIYTWITNNIAFDYNRLSSSNYLIGVSPKDVLRTKKALSDGYAELLMAMLKEARIEAETVTGYVHDAAWSPGELTLESTHVWVAMLIDGEWKLCDPAWDAGYIGRLPYHSKPYQPKKYLINIEWYKKDLKRKKIEEKRKKTEDTRLENYNSKPKYKDKIGFVQDPELAYFMVDVDSFALDHLPLNPIWQLRKDYVSINDFALSRDSLKLRLSQLEPVNNLDFIKEIENYRSKDYLHQYLENGEKGFEYNPLNPGIKMLNYYNFLYLVHSKNLQKYARGSVYEIEEQNYPFLTSINDTIIKYTKLYRSFEKDIYKSRKQLDKSKYKAAQLSDKANTKLITKIASENEKLLKYIDGNDDRIKSNEERLEEMIEDINADFPYVGNYRDPKDLKEQYIKPWQDTMQMYFDSLEFIKVNLHEKRNKTSYNTLLSDVHYLNYLLSKNGEFIQFKSYSNNETIQLVDSIISARATRAVGLYKDSLRSELIQKDVMSLIKGAKTYARLAKSNFKSLEKQGLIGDIRPYEGCVQAKLYDIVNLANQINMNSESFNKMLVPELKGNKELKQLTGLIEEQVELNEEKNEFIQEQVEKSHERSIDLVEDIQDNSKKWKQKYKE